jgi:hypothetical protein
MSPLRTFEKVPKTALTQTPRACGASQHLLCDGWETVRGGVSQPSHKRSIFNSDSASASNYLMPAVGDGGGAGAVVGVWKAVHILQGT